MACPDETVVVFVTGTQHVTLKLRVLCSSSDSIRRRLLGAAGGWSGSERGAAAALHIR